MSRISPLFCKYYVAILLIFIVSSCSPSGPNRDELVTRCDSLTSHPSDVARRAIGITDNQIIPSIAIEYCEKARVADPNNPRIQFGLGRAYWSANRDSEAFNAFTLAAMSEYPPAMKYIGDAFLEGRGLPRGINQDAQVAMDWYKKSGEAGFKDGALAYQEVQQSIKKITLDLSIFNKPNYISYLYNATIDSDVVASFFTIYVRALASEIGGNKILYVDQKCRPLVNTLNIMNFNFSGILAVLNSAKNEDSVLIEGFSFLFGKDTAEDFGSRDALILINEYGCGQNSITKRILANIPYTMNVLIRKKSEIPAKR